MHRRVLCSLACVNTFPAPKAMASSRHRTGAKISLSTFQSKCLSGGCVLVADLVHRQTVWFPMKNHGKTQDNGGKMCVEEKERLISDSVYLTEHCISILIIAVMLNQNSH